MFSDSPPGFAGALQRLERLTVPAILLDGEYRILAANAAYRDEHREAGSPVGAFCYAVSHGYDRPCDQVGESCPLAAVRGSGLKERRLHIHQALRGREYVEVEIQPVEGDYYLEVLRPTLIASAGPSPVGLVGRAPAFYRVLELVHQVAREPVPVLLLGESGTGKELIARAIHEASDRVERPFVPVECSGLAENLFESELFGHLKGAFTSANQSKAGLVEVAHRGTLFLDEIGEVPLQLQVKLLRLLETRTFRRVGAVESRTVDFRLICATNRDLRAMVGDGSFRKDLYYRLSTFPIELPPLRRRREDIGLLARSLLLRMAAPNPPELTREAETLLENYPFPGNIRELQNLLERARILGGGRPLRSEHFPELTDVRIPDLVPVPDGGPDGLFRVAGIVPLERLERDYLRHVVAGHGGGRQDLAERLGVSLRTLARKLERAWKE
ncbi:MAG: sigma-54-dependent Fis family transcriptional regulator [Magnetococcales bacterium]|nr:sigma-54-dependent Fis family transcriptional regulator [Magnetococcales bacterium]